MWEQVVRTLGTGDDLVALLRDWHFLARDDQLPPPGDWSTWLFMAGRGAGKTRAGAEWARRLILSGYDRGGLVAPTAADARDVMVEGESGLLACCHDDDRADTGALLGRPKYEPSKRRITWSSGQRVAIYSADEPDRLRGPQHSFLWLDELAAWRRSDAYDQALFGLRLGRDPRVLITTTPRPRKLMQELYRRARDRDDSEVVVTTSTSESNERNLAPGVLDALRRRYGGTSLGRQELDGALLQEAEGALWARKDIDKHRAEVMPTVADDAFFFRRIVVGVDPATTSRRESDETGIVVAALGSDDHAYVLADYSGTYTPAAWGEKVAAAMKQWQGDLVVAEGNQGGEMVAHVLCAADANLPVRIVHASRGKVARAEPVSQRYERGEVHHVGRPTILADGSKHEGHLDDLEDQMCTWDRLSATYSPDRIDALVWALHELLIAPDQDLVTTRLVGWS